MMSEVKRVKATCPDCGPDRWALVRAEFVNDVDDGSGTVWWRTEHRVLQCPACDRVYHQTDQIFSEDYTYGRDEAGEESIEYGHTIKHWPSPIKRETPAWVERLPLIDIDLHRLLVELYGALEADLTVLAAIGARTVFDRGSELLGIDPAIKFEEKLQKLVTDGFIGSTERDALAVMTDAGSASAHRGWRPTEEQLETMLQILEAFLHRNFVLRTDLAELTNAIPAKPRRRPPPAT